MCQDDAECLKNAHASDNKYYLNPDGTVDIQMPQQEETETIDVKKPIVKPPTHPTPAKPPMDPIDPEIGQELPPLIPMPLPPGADVDQEDRCDDGT